MTDALRTPHSAAMPAQGRRAFLRQLAALPLIGGSVAILGTPSAVAEPATEQLLLTYQQWLSHEFDRSTLQLYGSDRWRHHRDYRRMVGAGHDFHRGPGGIPYTDAFGNSSPLPSSRAALVLSTVGCDWRE